MANLIFKAVSEGGPYAIALVGVLGWLAWFWERKQHKETIDALRELSGASVEATTKCESAIATNTKIMEQFVARNGK